MKAYINSSIKQRESFRPFAPSVMVEHAEKYFGISDSPFMLRVGPVAGEMVPAVTHVDGTARFQTVARKDNLCYHDLLRSFCEITNIPMLLNTSFNGKCEPIVETPEHALCTMLETKLDAVVFPGLIVMRD